jgi:hydroxyacylglutathione hydrolase
MQISKQIHALKIPFTVPTPMGNIERFVYVFLICGKGVTLIDSGVAGSEESIFAYLESIGRGREELDLLILTHSHPDHIGAACAIRAETGCRVAASEQERAWIEDTDRQLRERPVPGFGTLVGGPVPLDRGLADGELLDLGGGLELETIATPGHSAGSLSFFLRDEGALFSGDAVPVPGDMPIYDDFATTLRSLERVGELTGVKLLLEAWQEPRAAEAGERIAAGRAWLQAIDAAVHQVRGRVSGAAAMDLCGQVVAELGLPPLAANPLVARSFRSHPL